MGICNDYIGCIMRIIEGGFCCWFFCNKFLLMYMMIVVKEKEVIIFVWLSW